MRSQVTPEIDPAVHVFSSGRRHTFDLDTADCALLTSAIKLVITTREAGKLIGTNTEETPAADMREVELLKLFEKAQTTEGANGTF